MIDAEEARKICLKAREQEIMSVETYLKNYVFNIIDDRIKTAAEMGQTGCKILICEILLHTGEVSEYFKEKTVKTLIEILEYQNFKVVNTGTGVIIIDWSSQKLM